MMVEWQAKPHRQEITDEQWHGAFAVRERLLELWEGLSISATFVHTMELNFSERQASLVGCTCGLFQWTQNSRKPLGYSLLGEIPLITRTEYRQIVCHFHWYAVTAVDFVRMHSKLYSELNGKSFNKVECVEAISEGMLLFRNKIAAHSSFHSPKDSGEEERASQKSVLLPKLELHPGPKFGVVMAKLKHEEKVLQAVGAQFRWILRDTHEEMERRFSGMIDRCRRT